MFSYDPTQAILGECLTYGTAKAICGQYPPHSTLNYDILTLQDVPRVFGLSRKFSIPLLDFMDYRKPTIRTDAGRKLWKEGAM